MTSLVWTVVRDGDVRRPLASFDRNVSDAVERTIAKRRSPQARFKDAGFGKDVARINVQEILRELSHKTEVGAI